MLHRLWRRRALIAWSLVFTLVFNAFAPAYAGFGLPSFGGFDPNRVVKDKAQGEIYRRLGEALGLSDPLLLDQKTAFKKVKDIPDFHPTHVSFAHAQDLFKRLEAGDYSFDVLAFCAQWSIHAPAQGVGYKLGLTQGKLADVISTLLVRGSLLGVDPNQLQAVSWRIQGGVPIGTWSRQDKALADRVIPDYEHRLKGDLLQEYAQKYAQFRASVPVGALPSSLDEVLPKLGSVGKGILAIKQARKTLEDKTLSAERLPDQLYEPQGDGLPRMLPANPPEAKPSVWVERSAGVFERLVIVEGNLKVNRLDVRITPEAFKAAKEDSLKLADNSGKGMKMAQMSPTIPAGGALLSSLTPAEILFGMTLTTVGVTALALTAIWSPETITGIHVPQAQQAYSQGVGTQSLTITPHLEPKGKDEENKPCEKVWHEGDAGIPLLKKVVKTFRDGTFTERVLDKPLKLYRVFGGKVDAPGEFWTTTEITNEMLATEAGREALRQKFALLPEWGNEITQSTTRLVPTGTTIYEGIAASQGDLPGGEKQIFIPNKELAAERKPGSVFRCSK